MKTATMAGECRPCRRKVCVNTNPAKEHQIYSHPLRGSVEPLEVPCKNAQPRYDKRKSQSCLERSQIGYGRIQLKKRSRELLSRPQSDADSDRR
jgi:hypothetical protein